MAKKKSILYPILFMMVITAVFTAVLAFLNQATEEKIAYAQGIEQKRKILYVFDIAPESETEEAVTKAFDERVEESTWNDRTLYVHRENGEVKAYAVPVNGPGLWGSIQGYVGVDRESQKLTGIEFIEQSETPGLGGRIAEEPYKMQYRDLDISKPQGEAYVINRPATGGNIDAIAGATLTSNFVTQLVNHDLHEFLEALQKGEVK